MSWGVRLLGMGNVLRGLKDIQVRLDDNAVYVVGTNVEYAIFQEFGTSRMAAQPHVMPAVRSVERDISRIAGDAQSANDAVKRIAFEVERRIKQRAPVDTGALKSSYRTERIR